MKIAVPTNDGISISAHFGRSAAFLIFETENGQIKGTESKKNSTTHTHAQGACDHHAAEPTHDHHDGILATLEGCEMVICAGMGQRAADALKGRGIQIRFTSIPSAEDAVSAHLAGKLIPATETFCGCKH